MFMRNDETNIGVALCRSGRGSAGSAGGHPAARSCATGVPFTPALHDRHIYRAVSYIFPITSTVQDFLEWFSLSVKCKCRKESPRYAAPHESSERERERVCERASENRGETWDAAPHEPSAEDLPGPKYAA